MQKHGGGKPSALFSQIWINPCYLGELFQKNNEQICMYMDIHDVYTHVNI